MAQVLDAPMTGDYLGPMTTTTSHHRVTIVQHRGPNNRERQFVHDTTDLEAELARIARAFNLDPEATTVTVQEWDPETHTWSLPAPAEFPA